jgi:prepilin-type N-terminal cleavage/methylation domain-containing protein
MHPNRKAFTLIELLIVVVIIGILAAIAIPKFANTKGKAFQTTMKSDLKNLTIMEESFFADSFKYSTDLTSLQFKQSTGVGVPAITTGAGFWLATITHPQLPGVVCGVGVNTTNPLNANGGQGEPICQ